MGGGGEGGEGGGWGEKVVKGAECECGKLKTDACFSFLSVLVLGIGHGYIDTILDVVFFLRPVNRKWLYQGKTKCIPPTTSINSDSLLNTHSSLFHC